MANQGQVSGAIERPTHFSREQCYSHRTNAPITCQKVWLLNGIEPPSNRECLRKKQSKPRGAKFSSSSGPISSCQESGTKGVSSKKRNKARNFDWLQSLT